MGLPIAGSGSGSGGVGPAAQSCLNLNQRLLADASGCSIFLNPDLMPPVSPGIEATDPPPGGGVQAASRKFVNTGWKGKLGPCQRYFLGYFFQPAFFHGRPTLTPIQKNPYERPSV